jgi:hypothetical protein
MHRMVFAWYETVKIALQLGTGGAPARSQRQHSHKLLAHDREAMNMRRQRETRRFPCLVMPDKS